MAPWPLPLLARAGFTTFGPAVLWDLHALLTPLAQRAAAALNRALKGSAARFRGGGRGGCCFRRGDKRAVTAPRFSRDALRRASLVTHCAALLSWRTPRRGSPR